MLRKKFSGSGSDHKEERSGGSPLEPSVDSQKHIKAAACQIASLIVFDDRYARAISFVSDPSENDEVAKMLNQIAYAAHTPVNLLKLLARAEFDINAASKDTILRTNSLASKSFGLYGRVICRDYVCAHVLPLVRDIVQSSDSLEINPDLLCRQPEVLSLPEEQRAAAIRDSIARNSIDLARCVSTIIGRLSSPAALLALPPPIVSILKFVGDLSSEINLSPSVFISCLFLLRLVNPALIQPEYYDSSVKFSEANRRKLLLITKIIQTLGNRGKFGAKESFMTVMIEHLESLECGARLDKFLSNILILSLDSDLREDVPHGGFDKSLHDDCLKTVRSFFCRHSIAILKRLQLESIRRSCSNSDMVSRDRSFVAAVTGLQSSSIQMSHQSSQDFKTLHTTMFQTYASAPQFDSMPDLESFDREKVCYCGPDALDGSAVVYFCLARLKLDHLRIANSILVRVYLLCAAASKRPFNILIDCSGVQASTAAIIAVIKDMATTLLAALEPASKKRLKHLFLVHPSVDALRDILDFISNVAPKLTHKVFIANRWTSLVDFIAADRILLPSSTLHSIGSLHYCVKINRKNKRQSRFVKIMIDSLANIDPSSSDSSLLRIKNEIMFCDIVSTQALSDPTKLLITYNSTSAFDIPPNQSQGYFFKNELFSSKNSTSRRLYEFRNSSERDDLLTALVVQKGLRLQISVASLDPTLTNVELTPERALYARVPCPVFVFTKIGKTMHATLERVLKLSCDSCLVMAGADIRNEISFHDIDTCWAVGNTAHIKCFIGVSWSFSLLDEAVCKQFVDSVRLGISACLSTNVQNSSASSANIGLFQAEQPPQSQSQPAEHAGLVDADEFASLSLGKSLGGSPAAAVPASPVPFLKRKQSKFVVGLGAVRSQSML